MNTFLLELGCEEIPSRFMTPLLTDLDRLLRVHLEKNRIDFSDLKTLGTYRRLVVQVDGLPERQNDLNQTVTGPPVAIAFDPEGKPLPPAIGFAKRMGVAVEALGRTTDKNKEVIAVEKEEKGQSIKECLPDVIQTVFKELPLPIAMKWGNNEGPFIRPVHWVLSILNDQVLALKLFGQNGSKETYGHRFLGQAASSLGVKVRIESPKEYEDALATHHVIVDPEIRKRLIVEALKANNQDTWDENLLTEVTFLVENPQPLIGTFESDFLKLPEEVLIASMKKHQKFFPLFDQAKLSNQFLVIAESVTDANRDKIIAGNQNVLVARLKDALFFWDEDLKEPLSNKTPRLEGVVFQKNMGTILDKTKRIEKIAQAIMKSVSSECDIVASVKDDDLQRCVSLCKADLVSHMVTEFPSLQGKVGALYAQKEGANDEVVKGIREHYYPLSSGAEVPSSALGLIIGIADRIDTIVCSYQNGLIPSGSQDPQGIRRAMFAIIDMLIQHGVKVDVVDLIESTYQILSDQFKFEEQKNKDKLLSFFSQRLKSYLMDKQLQYDTVEATLESGLRDVNWVWQSTQGIDGWRSENQDAFKLLADTAVRVKRLSQKLEADKNVNVSFFEDDSERTMWSHFESIELSTDIGEGLSQLAKLSEPITAFFDAVLVMADDEKVRHNRLSMLAEINDTYSRFADFEKFVV